MAYGNGYIGGRVFTDATLPHRGSSEDRWGTIESLFAIFYIPALALLLLIWQYRLVISPIGVEYYELPMRIRATWDDIEKVMFTTYGAFLICRQRDPAGQPMMARILARLRPTKRIPLTAFMWQWQNGIEEDLRQYAPHLAAEGLEIRAMQSDPSYGRIKRIYQVFAACLVVWMTIFGLAVVPLIGRLSPFRRESVLILLLALPVVFIVGTYAITSLVTVSSVLVLRRIVPRSLIKEFLHSRNLQLPNGLKRYILDRLLREDT